ncbi:AbrB/MazE/SpoVT family DNA-binding domain-containing protein [Inquilinus sp. CAU 1745]|uniref:AbrB/MazE/SpoVT family DNA-binding domain-containing protein n=1 Tax=Inquilinus sp. CAU 1745 TaxID=3140369 RepID=UPI00325B34F3
MRAQISRWGNSLAVRVPKPLADAMALTEGSAVEIEVAEGALKVTPARPRYRLEDLLAGIGPDNLPESFDDGPVGEERL